MPHVSTNKLNSRLSEDLYGKFIDILKRAQKDDALLSVVNELFTATEKIMFAKRLAIILMIEGKVSQVKVAELLKVSSATIAKTSLEIEIGKYNAILKISKSEGVNFGKLIKDILTVGGIMPPKVGRIALSRKKT